MRRKEWSNVKDAKTGKPFFSTQSHQNRYDIMAETLELFERMTDQEYIKLRQAIESREKEQGKQTTLFV